MENKTENKKVLLIEDDLFINDLYSRSLEKAGFEVVKAFDGEEGWQKIKEGPGLVLLDIMLPKMNGLVLLEKIKTNAEYKNIPVVLVTNLGQEEVIKKAFRLGAQGYLMKMRILPGNIIDTVNKFMADPGYIMDLREADLE